MALSDVIVVGANGRLGTLIVNEATRSGHVALSVTRAAPLTALARPANGTVVIDVSTAGATAVHAAWCAQQRCPLLVATTGLSADDHVAINAAASVVPVLVAANLSLSAHVAARAAGAVASALSTHDVEIVESHHRFKKDAPSGTALMLAGAVRDARNGAGATVAGRHGLSPRQPGDIGISAVRGGDVVGEHTVLFLGEGERIEISHRVTDRAIFARGALGAAAFLASSPPGLYGMGDVVARLAPQ